MGKPLGVFLQRRSLLTQLSGCWSSLTPTWNEPELTCANLSWALVARWSLGGHQWVQRRSLKVMWKSSSRDKQHVKHCRNGSSREKSQAGRSHKTSHICKRLWSIPKSSNPTSSFWEMLPRRKDLYETCIRKAEATQKPLSELKPEVSDQQLGTSAGLGVSSAPSRPSGGSKASGFPRGWPGRFLGRLWGWPETAAKSQLLVRDPYILSNQGRRTEVHRSRSH